MPKVVLERFGGRLLTDDGRQIAAAEWVLEDKLFFVFLTVPLYQDRELVAVTKRICYVPALVRGVLETQLAHATRQQWLDRNLPRLMLEREAKEAREARRAARARASA